MRKVIFLDRDGTLIVDKNYLNDPEQIEFIDGVFVNLRHLRDLGYQFIVVTNQSGLARGLIEWDQMQTIHQRLRGELASEGIDIVAFYYAPELVEFFPRRRKPEPGMLLTASREYNVGLQQSWMIGDNIWDVIAGLRAGCRAIQLSPFETPRLQLNCGYGTYSRVSTWNEIFSIVLTNAL